MKPLGRARDGTPETETHWTTFDTSGLNALFQKMRPPGSAGFSLHVWLLFIAPAG